MKLVSATVTLLLITTCLGRTVEQDSAKMIDLPIVTAKPEASFSLEGVLARVGQSTREPPCPDEVAIAPCLCSLDADGAMLLDCSAVESEDQLAGVFQHDFPSTAFKTFYINNNNQITTIGDIFNGLTFVEFILTNLVNLVSIPDTTFAASVDTLEVVFLSNTNLTETGLPLATLPDYSVMRELALLTTPLSAMFPLQSDSLEELRIFDSLVNSFGAGTFDNLNNLNRLEIGNSRLWTLFSDSIPITNSNYSVYLYHNNIGPVEPGLFVLPTETDSLSVYLNMAQNYITVLEETVFGEIFPYVYEFVIYGNILECGCDMAWLVTNPDYLSKVDGAATCADGVKLADLDPNYYLENC